MAATPKKMMQLNFTDICCTTDHLGLGQWKSPTSSSRYKDRLEYYIWMAQLAEKGKMTSIFFADTYGTHETYGGSSDSSFAGGTGVASLDPVVMVSAMAHATKNVSFAITGNTTYLKPYILARTWSTLDHMTRGRIGWNVVTGYGKSAAKAMGEEDAMPRDERYLAADEYMSLAYSLWEKSWEDGAQVWSVEPELAYDPSKVHRIEFNGKYHKLSASSQAHPSPQRTPTLFQAGASKAGISFAAKHAEGIYCGAATIPDLLKYTKQIRAAAIGHGRDPSTIKIFCGMTPILGRTVEEAYAKRDALQAHSSYVAGLAAFCGYTGVDLSKYELDEPFTFDDASEDNASIQGIFNIFKSIEREDNEPWTPRRLGEFYAFGGLGPMPVGTPAMVADIFEEWLVGADLDGFNIQYVSNPGSFEDVVELLVPELQRRGVYWKDYPAPRGTFRENLQSKPGQPFTGPDHPSARFKWNAPKTVDEHTKEESLGQRELSNGMAEIKLNPTTQISSEA